MPAAGVSLSASWEQAHQLSSGQPVAKHPAQASHSQHLHLQKGRCFLCQGLLNLVCEWGRWLMPQCLQQTLVHQLVCGVTLTCMISLFPASLAILSATSSSDLSLLGPGSGITSTNCTLSCRCPGLTWGPCTTTVPWSAQVRCVQGVLVLIVD